MAGMIRWVAAMTLTVFVATPAHADIRTSKHNLSVTGPGTIKAVAEDRICRFCHVPHNAAPAVPLWSRGFSAATYTVYTSTTIQGSIGQPNGSSKLCLSCHDGAFAVSSVGMSSTVPTGTFAMTNGVNYVVGRALIGTNLSDDHPVSLTVATGGNADPEIVINPADPKVKYDSSGRVQCTSCHNPHDDTNPNFLVKSNLAGGFGSQICIVCHVKTNWVNSSHRNSAKLYGGKAIQAEACAICHRTHNALIPGRLLAGSEEGLCDTCHNGSTSVSPATKNVAGEFAKAYRHPIATVGKHNPAEGFSTLSDPLSPDRHSECEDCHNPHSAQSGAHTQGSSKIGAALLGAWGMKPIYGATPWTDPISWEKVQFTSTLDADALEAYLCFKCHKSLAKYFNPSNPSYHAVVGLPKADPTYSGSYLNGWTPTSQMTCSDCHSSDNAGVRGPHGSNYALNRHWNNATDTAVNDPIIAVADYIRGGGHGPSMSSPHYTNRGTGGTYDGDGNVRSSDEDLCFKCHNRSVYGAPYDSPKYSSSYEYGIYVTGYRYTDARNLHLTHMRGKACTTCHAVHGSNKPHLLAFGGEDFSLNSRLSASSVPSGGGWSYVTCHGGSYTGC